MKTLALLIVAILAAVALGAGYIRERAASIAAAADFARDSAAFVLALERLEVSRDSAYEAARAAEAHAIAEHAFTASAIADYDRARAELRRMHATAREHAAEDSAHVGELPTPGNLTAEYVAAADSLRSRCERLGDACNLERAARARERFKSDSIEQGLRARVDSLDGRLSRALAVRVPSSRRNLLARALDGLAGASVGYGACRLLP